VYVDFTSSWWQMSSSDPGFQLAIDGSPVEIVRTVRGPHPLAAVMLFDVSGSLSELDSRFEPAGALDVEQAAKRFASVARPDDQLRIGTVGTKIAIGSPLLTDPKSASKAASEIRQRGGPSPIWDAMDRSLAVLANQPGLHAILIHTDGQASGNDIGADEILTRALKAGVVISAVGVSDRGLPYWRQSSAIQIVGRNDWLLRLVEQTGGSYFELKEPKDLPVEYFVSILDRLRKAYRLDFASPVRDGRLHEVSVTAGGRPARTPKFIAYR